jgi:DNA mismatch repair protein MutS
LAAGQSTFMVEMSETANILRRATNRSFIIFDEIGRGTATYDGMAIAQSVLEFLNNMAPRTLFATHYHELTALSGDNDGVLNMVSCLTIDVREYNNEIIFMHKIVNGVANRSYGIAVAKMAGMPASVVERAEQVLMNLENNTDSNKVVVQEKPSVKPVVEEPKQNPQLSLFG